MKKIDAEDMFRFRWEFMRRDPQYVEAFKRIEELKKRIDDIRLGIRFDKARKISLNFSEDFPWNAINFARQRKSRNIKVLLDETKKVFNEFDLNFIWDPIRIPDFPNPSKSFDELNPFETNFLLSAFKSKAVIIQRYLIEDKNKIINNPDGLLININFNEVNSIEALKQMVSYIIGFIWKHYEAPYRFGYLKRKRTNRTHYEMILKAGLLKKENPHATYRELAEIIFPKETDPESTNSSPESAIKKCEQYLKRYEELTENGGWKNLKFP